MKNVFIQAEANFRTGDYEIYKGFGLRHNQEIDLYIPDWCTSFKHEERILVCQTNAEAIISFAEILKHIYMGEPGFGDVRWDDDKYKIFIEYKVLNDWRDNSKVNRNLGSFKAVIYGDCIQVGAYDLQGKFIPSSFDFPKKYSKFFPVIALFIAHSMLYDEDFYDVVRRFCVSPTRDDFLYIYLYIKDKYHVQDFELNYNIISSSPFKNANSLLEEFSLSKEYINTNDTEDEREVKSFRAEDFKEEYLNLIPEPGPEFLFPQNLLNLADAIAEGDIKSVLFSGPAGTGKTMNCKLIAQRIRIPLMETVNCTENLDEFVLGKYIPEGKSIVFNESFVTKAIRDGGLVVFEEINFAKPQYIAFLNSLLDDNGFVRLDNGEVVRRNENFRFMATMNVGYFGTRELNQALFNRFQAVVMVKELSDDAIRNMLVGRIPDCAGFADTAIDLYHQIKDKIRREELDAVISPRNIENWMRMCKYEAIEVAAEMTVIPIAKGDKDMETEMRLMIKQCVRR